MTDALEVQAFARGINELLVLALLRDGPKHGYQIALQLERRSGGLFSLAHGTLYPILHRLEREKRIRGSWAEEGGRRRKVYSLTVAGRRQLAEDAARCDRLFRGLLSLIEEVTADSGRVGAGGAGGGARRRRGHG